MKFRVVIEYDPETKCYSAHCPELPGCCTAGDTEQDATENMKEAISLYLEPCALQLSPGEKVCEVDVLNNEPETPQA